MNPADPSSSDIRPPAAVVFGHATLDTLTAAARGTPRLRKNLNFHAELSDPAQRLLNAVDPASYIRPHRHLEPLRDETFVVLRGAFGLVLFDASGGVSQTALLRAGGDAIGAHVPAGIYHTLVSLEAGSVFFEAKPGPYVPITDKDFGAWAPREGDPDAPAYLEKLRTLFIDPGISPEAASVSHPAAPE